MQFIPGYCMGLFWTSVFDPETGNEHFSETGSGNSKSISPESSSISIMRLLSLFFDISPSWNSVNRILFGDVYILLHRDKKSLKDSGASPCENIEKPG